MDSLAISHQQQIVAATEPSSGPPEKIASDYVELVSLILLFIVGAPLNLAAWTQIAERPVSSRLDILKKHLNYSDLLVLFIYVPSRACWLVTYDWRGGDLLCRLFKFAHTFAFQISSNVIVCIALDRLLSVLSASHRNPEQAARRMRLMLLAAWITALLISTPQFAVWRSFQAFDNPPWSQCMQIWEIQRALVHRMNSNGTAESVVSQLMHEENVYVVLHMLLIFWIPAAIILLCYLLLSAWVYINSRPNFFDLANSTSGIEKCAGGPMAAEMQPLDPQNGLAPQQQAQQQVGVLVALRPSRVSYQLTTMTTSMTSSSSIPGNPMPLNTMLTNNGKNSPNNGGNCDASNATKKPTIVINDDQNRPVPFSQSPSPKPMSPNKADQRNSSTVSQEAAAALLLANNRQRQSSSYSAKSQRNRAIRVSFLLVVGYFACWLPYNCLSLVQFIDPQLYHRHASKVYSLHGIIVFNSVINPYLYGLCGGLCRQTRRNS